jgi:hypothetical protein
MSGMSEMGGKETTGVFVVHPEIQFFFFFFGVTWKAPRQRGMDAGWTRDGRLELLILFKWFKNAFNQKKKKKFGSKRNHFSTVRKAIFLEPYIRALRRRNMKPNSAAMVSRLLFLTFIR